jgi:hypothetical protein
LIESGSARKAETTVSIPCRQGSLDPDDHFQPKLKLGPEIWIKLKIPDRGRVVPFQWWRSSPVCVSLQAQFGGNVL